MASSHVTALRVSVVLFLTSTLAFGGASCGTAASFGHSGVHEGGTSTTAPSFDDATPPDESCPRSCSADLHAILDCRGREVSRCAAEDGCAGGVCVPSCAAAEANQSNVGCEYYVAPPTVIADTRGSCFAVFVANTWDTPIALTLERDGIPLDLSSAARIPRGNGAALTYETLPHGTLPAGEVGIVFVSGAPPSPEASNRVACPVPPALAIDSAVHGTARGRAFRLSTSAPATAYDIFPFGGGAAAMTSATLLLPTSTWGRNYVAVSAYPKSRFVPEGQPTLTVVAAEADTHVTLAPSVSVIGNAAVDGTPAGTPHTYSLARGEYLQIAQDEELTGTPVHSDKRIGVWGGSSCLTIGLDSPYCDSAHQQLPPVRSLGHEYVAVRYRARHELLADEPPWRFVGAVDGTVLTYETASGAATPKGAPDTLRAGGVATFQTGEPFVVRSQDPEHPFYVSAHMTGGMRFAGRGDPEFVNVVPTAQYLSRYVFFTDPTYSETDLVVVRSRGSDGAFHDVFLDCAGRVAGFSPLGRFEWARADLVRGDFEPQGTCDNGRHSMFSDAPFALTVWGWGSTATGGPGLAAARGGPPFFTQHVSYAYPGGAGVAPVNDVVVPATPK